MRKYLQITIVLGAFFGLVFLRNLHGGEDAAPIIGKQNSSSSSSSSDASSSNHTTSPASSVTYKDGIYTGSVEDVFYGDLQVQAVISGGKLTDVTFIKYPNDNPTSVAVNTQAISVLKSEAIQAQSAQVDIVSGASDSSLGFQKSLAHALAQAK